MKNYMPEQLASFMEKVFNSGFGYVWFILLAIWGGTVNYISRLKDKSSEKFSFVELIGEWTISGFAGLLTAYVCIELELTWHMTAFFTGVAGHLGGRAIFLFELFVKSKFQNIFK